MRGLVHIPDNVKLWPKEWGTVFYKTYSRFPKIPLVIIPLEESFEKALLKRSSVRKWDAPPVTLEQISTILYNISGIKRQETKKGEYNKNLETRILPSGGARYPVEAYVLILKKGELEERLYHYNIKENALDVLWEISKEERSKLFSYEWAKGAGAVIFLTGVPYRTTMKYGERGYRYMYYEAGGISAVGHIVACSVGLNSVIMGGTNDLIVEDMLGIDGEKESLLLGILLG